MQVSDPKNGDSGPGGIPLPKLLCPVLHPKPEQIASLKHCTKLSGALQKNGPSFGNCPRCSPSLAYHANGCSKVRNTSKSISLHPGRHSAVVAPLTQSAGVRQTRAG